VIFDARPALDWSALFGDARAVEIEIGSGKGAFILAYAREHPELNVLGIESQPRWVRWIETRREREALANLRVVCADAALVVARFVPDASVRA
jgi:tRNA (guanine-N7-)-methyltransferase